MAVGSRLSFSNSVASSPTLLWSPSPARAATSVLKVSASDCGLSLSSVVESREASSESFWQACVSDSASSPFGEEHPVRKTSMSERERTFFHAASFVRIGAKPVISKGNCK
jgi:hypothetical protein